MHFVNEKSRFVNASEKKEEKLFWLEKSFSFILKNKTVFELSDVV